MQCIVSESIFQLIKWSQKAPQPTKFTLNVIPQNEGGLVAFLRKRHSSKNQTFKQNTSTNLAISHIDAEWVRQCLIVTITKKEVSIVSKATSNVGQVLLILWAFTFWVLFCAWKQHSPWRTLEFSPSRILFNAWKQQLIAWKQHNPEVLYNSPHLTLFCASKQHSPWGILQILPI